MRRESGYMQGGGGIRTGLRDGGEEIWGRVKRVRVEDRTKSDHFPVVVWIRGEVGVSRRAGGGRRRRWRWTEGKREFREKIKRVWQGKGGKEKVEWGEMKGVIQTILREGQEGEGKKREDGGTRNAGEGRRK